MAVFDDLLRINCMFIKKKCNFAPELVMHGCFIRARKGNQVKNLSSTRYCDPHYEKSIKSH